MCVCVFFLHFAGIRFLRFQSTIFGFMRLVSMCVEKVLTEGIVSTTTSERMNLNFGFIVIPDILTGSIELGFVLETAR